MDSHLVPRSVEVLYEDDMTYLIVVDYYERTQKAQIPNFNQTVKPKTKPIASVELKGFGPLHPLKPTIEALQPILLRIRDDLLKRTSAFSDQRTYTLSELRVDTVHMNLNLETNSKFRIRSVENLHFRFRLSAKGSPVL